MYRNMARLIRREGWLVMKSNQLKKKERNNNEKKHVQVINPSKSANELNSPMNCKTTPVFQGPQIKALTFLQLVGPSRVPYATVLCLVQGLAHGGLQGTWGLNGPLPRALVTEWSLWL